MGTFARYGVARILAIGLILVGSTVAAGAAGGERRVALVVGNAAYAHIERLANSGNDAKLIAETLKHLGFTLVGGGAQLDLDKATFEQRVREFGQRIQGADVALFYYAGHGMQVQGVNWLLPTDAAPARVQDVDFQLIDAGLVLKQMDGAGTRLNIVLLDACRTNPFAGMGTRGGGGGLAQMRAPEGTLISFATQPGNVAADGAGADGPYAIALADAMRQPDLDIFRTFNRVGLQVKRETGNAQQPWMSNSPIDGDFFFNQVEAAPDATVSPAPDGASSQPPSGSREGKGAAPATAPSADKGSGADKGGGAGKGSTDADVALGLQLLNGTGVAKDYAGARQAFQRAAGRKSAEGAYFLGLMLERGYGVSRNYHQALDLYRFAAEQDYRPAELAVARFYDKGLGVVPNADERRKWLLRAAEQGSPSAQHLLGNIYRLGLGVPKDPAAAAGWYRRAVKQNFVLSEVQLAFLYEHGSGVRKSYGEAAKLLRRAAEKNNSYAQNALGFYYERGWSVPRDYAQAFHWYQLSADQGNHLAEYNLGRLYADGLGRPRDPATATKLFELAAAGGNEHATARLARMQGGQPVPSRP
jgi:TPR repeat protein